MGDAQHVRDSWTLTLLKVAWPVEGAVLVLVTIIVLFAAVTRMSAWMGALPILAGIVAAQGAVAFGGPAIKRRQQNQAGNGGGEGK